ncbi:acetamidase/formamidase family protein [candidate division KSB1 bacterium]|nr:acetamidase/formamidase family protein [candidate division KSB1 bacterium]
MKRLTRERLQYFFDKDIEPLAVIKPGECIEIETEDAIAGQLNPDTVNSQTLAEMRARIPCSNPVTGPIFIEGAHPGDALAVKIIDIDVAPREQYAWTVFAGNEGMLTNAESIHPPLPEVKRILPIRNGALQFEFARKTVKVPVNPAIGTIGVAPSGERRYSFLNGNDFLGNVDIPCLGVGKTILLPVQVEGGLLSLGDIHAVSGHGEISGGAADCRSVVQVKIDVCAKSECGFMQLPQLNCDEFIGTIATGGSLDKAVKLAYRDLLFRMHHNYQFELLEAYQLLSSVGELQVGQMIPPIFHSVLALIRRDYL